MKECPDAAPVLGDAAPILDDWVQPGGACSEPRVILSRRAIWLAVVMVGAFVPIDLFLTGYLVHAAIELLAFLLLLGAVLMLRDPARLALAQWVATIAVALTIVLIMVNGEIQDGVLVWLVLFPPIPFYLGGIRRGLALSALFSGIVLSALFGMVASNGQDAPTWVAMLNASGALLAATVLSYLYEQSRADAQRRLAAAANLDPLTGVANRRGFVAGFEVRRRFVRRSGCPLSLLVFDLDQLKPINDGWGHAAGDAVIRHVSSLVAGEIREQDLLGRMGGDEFALILPDTTLDGALTLADKLRARLQATPVCLPGGKRSVSVSIGVAEARSPDQLDLDRLLAAADEQLYRVKQQARGGQRGTRLTDER